MSKVENAHDLDEMVQHSLGKEGLRAIIEWVARFSYWVPPEVYQEIQVVFPETRRKHTSRERRGQVVDGVRVWENQPARYAFWHAYGDSPTRYRNYVVCHIYEGSPYLPEHFTNLANLTILPTCLESFSEWVPIRAVLKWHAYRTYGYLGPAEVVPRQPEYSPAIWPGVRRLDPETARRIVSDLKERRERRPAYYSRSVPQEVQAT